MGTKIVEGITTNLLGLKSVDRSGFIRFGVNGRRKSLKETLRDETKEEEEEEKVTIVKSMDRFLDKQNAESIRHTMQAQEDIFKQQVRELHRVYNIQKMMMDQLKHRSQYWTSNNKDQTGSRERTGSCSSIDLERVVRATKTTTTDHIEESELELTLSIGMSSSSTNKDMDFSSTTTSFRSSSDNCNNQSNNNNNNNSNNQENSGPNTPISSSSTTSLDREKKRPHWLFQGLSINRTS